MTPRRTRLLWWAVGTLLYLGGLAGSLFVAVDVYLAAPARPFETISTAHLLALSASLAASVAGRAITWKFGGGGPSGSDPRRDQSPLQRLGYRGPDPPADAAPEAVAGEAVACRECGTANDPAFSYCRECSAELPE